MNLVHSFTFSIDCPDCGGAPEILVQDQSESGDPRCHVECVNCGERWTVTGLIRRTPRSQWALHDRLASGRRTVA